MGHPGVTVPTDFPKVSPSTGLSLGTGDGEFLLVSVRGRCGQRLLLVQRELEARRVAQQLVHRPYLIVIEAVHKLPDP